MEKYNGSIPKQIGLNELKNLQAKKARMNRELVEINAQLEQQEQTI